MTIEIKNENVLNSLLCVEYHPTLILLAKWTTRFPDVVFTSGYRRGDDGVHGQIPCRGLDIRSCVYEQYAEMIVDNINKHFIYDPERPRFKCAILHDMGKGIHIHLQVHDNTIYLEKI